MFLAVDFQGSWTKFWNAISGQWGQVSTIVAIIGMLMVVAALVTYAWQRRRGQGGQAQGIWGAMLVGVLLAAPEFVIPVALFFVDLIVNAFISFWNNVS